MNVEYTEHEFFKIERGGTMAFEHIPEDGSRKMEDDLMESLEPYDFKDAVPFKDPYLQVMWQNGMMWKQMSVRNGQKNVQRQA